jgi:hypothetical protein
MSSQKRIIKTRSTYSYSPSPPKWQTVLTDWVSVTIPLPIFREWNGKLEDARLWLLGTSPPVARVILVHHVEGKILHDNRSEDVKTERKLMDAEVEELLADGTSLYCDKEEPADDEVKTVTARSNEKHAQKVLINKLLSANSENNLMKPLLGPVESRLSVFRGVRDGDNPENIICKKITTDEGNAVQQIYPVPGI